MKKKPARVRDKPELDSDDMLPEYDMSKAVRFRSTELYRQLAAAGAAVARERELKEAGRPAKRRRKAR